MRYLQLGVLLGMFCVILPAIPHRGVVRFGKVPVPGATVTATQGERSLAATTDQQGVYTFQELAAGTWKITVEMLCFSPSEQTLSLPKDASSVEWNLALLPLDAIQAKLRTMSSTSIASQSTVVGAVAEGGVQPLSQKQTSADEHSGFKRPETKAATNDVEMSDKSGLEGNNAKWPAAAGVDVDGFLINGSVNNGASTPFAQLAGFGNARRGFRPLYRGSIGLVVRGSFWDARSYSMNGQDTPKPAYGQVQGMASIGGPIRIPFLLRNGPNLTASYEWTRNRNASSPATRMPTALERVGDFSQTRDNLGRPVTAVDPTTGLPFPNNLIPGNRLSPQALLLLSYFPLTNAASPYYNYQVPLVGSTHSDAVQIRLNQSLGRRDSLSSNFGLLTTRTDSTNIFNFVDTTGLLGYQGSVNGMHRFSTHVFATAAYQFSRQMTRTTPFFAGRTNVAAEAGITGTNQDSVNWGPPQLNFSSGIASLTDSQSSRLRNQTQALSSSLFWSHGAHNVTVGGDIRRLQNNPVSQSDPRGTFNFTGAAAGVDFAGLLLGIPDTSSIAYGNADKYFRSWMNDAFVGDDWRLSPWLTLNAGMRWEYVSPVTEKYGRLVNLDISPGFQAIAPVVAADPIGFLTGRSYPNSMIEPMKAGVEPRIGLAWRPRLSSPLVVRAGYGIYRDTGSYLAIATLLSQQAPLSTSLSLNNQNTPLTLANAFFMAPNVATTTFAVDPNFQNGYSQTWQFAIQRDLPGSLVMSATYLGVKGTRLQQQFLPQTVPQGAVSPCSSCPVGYQFLTSNGNSTRNSGTLQIRRRPRSGFAGQFSYTWSKSIDNSGIGGRSPGANPSAVIAQDWLNLDGERGPSAFDQRHLVSAQVQYTTGMGLKGGTLLDGWTGRLLQDWTIIVNLTAGTGLPLNPIYGAATRGTSVTGSVRPSYTGADIYAAQEGLFLNSLAVTAPLLGEWGNAGRNSITGPGQFSLNAALGRTIRATDRITGEFRLESSNVLNHPTYTGWNVMASSAQFGLPTAVNAMRTLQASIRFRF